MLNKIKSFNPLIKEYYASVAIFLFFALSLIVPSGYSYGALLLFIGSLFYIFNKTSWQILDKNSKWFLAALLLFFLSYALEIIIHNSSIEDYEYPLKILIFAGIFIYLLNQKIKQEFLWLGIAAGAILTGLAAIYLKTTTDATRITVHTQLIQHGNISMLLGLLSLVGILWSIKLKKHRNLTTSILILGFILGVTSSLLSGSRGGWIGIPLILLIILPHIYKQSNKKIFYSALSIILISMIAFIFSSSEFKHRINSAKSELNNYFLLDHQQTSIGSRFELFKGAAIMIVERPLTGWGRVEYSQKIDQLRADNIINPHLTSHPHNDLLNAGAKRGVIGIIGLLFIYLIPILIFTKSLSSSMNTNVAIPLAGLTAILCYIDFGLSQSFLSHNSGLITLLVITSVFIAINYKQNFDSIHNSKSINND